MPGPCTNAAVLLLLGTYKYLEQICGGLRHVFERAAIPQARAQNARERRTGSGCALQLSWSLRRSAGVRGQGKAGPKARPNLSRSMRHGGVRRD